MKNEIIVVLSDEEIEFCKSVRTFGIVADTRFDVQRAENILARLAINFADETERVSEPQEAVYGPHTTAWMDRPAVKLELKIYPTQSDMGSFAVYRIRH